MIEVKDICVSFGEQAVLRDISFEIEKRKTVLVVGQSGCGKSVLMKTICGLLEAEKGKVLIDGVDLSKCSRQQAIETRQKLTMLFQGSALLDSLNVYQNIALPLFEHTGMPAEEIEKQVRAKLELVGLGGILHKMPSELSGGMKKRVAFARAIITNPDYIIYDEPTTGLDPVLSSEIVKLITLLHKQQETATVIVTHDLYCLEKISGRVIMLSEQEIIFDGSYETFKNSSDERIRKFLYSTER